MNRLRKGLYERNKLKRQQPKQLLKRLRKKVLSPGVQRRSVQYFTPYVFKCIFRNIYRLSFPKFMSIHYLEYVYISK